MERQANYVIVGIVSILLLIGTVVFVVWLANFQFNQTWDSYRIVFRGPVSGLSKGGDVQFNGIKVGEITHIALDPNDANRVLTDLQIEHDTPVRTDSVAQALTLGITGVKYVQISPGSATRPLLRTVSRDRPPIIASGRGRMDDFVENLSKVAVSGAEAVDRINRVLSDGNIGNLSRTLGDVQAVTAELRGRRSMFTSMSSAFANLDRASTDLRSTMASARGSLGGKGGALADIAMASSDLHETVTSLNSILGKVDGSVSELSTTTVPRVTFAMESVQKAADRLDGLAFRLEQDPGLLIKGRSGQERKVPK